MTESRCARPPAGADAAVRPVGVRRERTSVGRGPYRQAEREAPIARDAWLASWVEAHGEELERHLLRMSLRAEDARDILQEVWVTALAAPIGHYGGGNT